MDQTQNRHGDLNRRRLLNRPFRPCLPLLALASAWMAPAGFSQAPPALAQDVKAAATVPTFDAVSIKPNKSGSGSSRISGRDFSFSATNVSLKMMLANAYGIRDGLISGVPGWGESARFDIMAKVVDPDSMALKSVNQEQRRRMMAAILTDRFHLQVHTETKTLPVYELVVFKDGPKFKETPGLKPDAGTSSAGKGQGAGSMNINNNKMTATGVPLSSLTAQLSGQLDRSVIDKTGLTGRYDLQLQWTPVDSPAKEAADAPPSIFTALQEQLGLKLVAAKGPVVTLVVDHVEPPTEN